MENIRKLVLLVMILGIIPIASIGTAIATDFLYIGDSDNTVKRFDADSGNIDTFISSGLLGPMGILFENNGNLLVSNQHVGTNDPGDILRYNGKTGVFEKALVPNTDANAPYAPHGIILKDSKIYVADMFSWEKTNPDGSVEFGPGRIRTYDEQTGAFLGDLDPTIFEQNTVYHPRSLVFGPDGYLYVSVRDFPSGIGGGVLRFKSDGSFDKVLIKDDGGVNKLNRPEGLVFGPDGNLYITSFRAKESDTDSIRIYSANGEFLRKIDLYKNNQPRAYAQVILFGPNGRLFVPITVPAEVRRYNVADGTYDSFIPAGKLAAPWYMTFEKTDPSTLAYRGE